MYDSADKFWFRMYDLNVPDVRGRILHKKPLVCFRIAVIYYISISAAIDIMSSLKQNVQDALMEP